MTFEAAKSMIEQKVRAGAEEKRMRKWEWELRKNTRIEIVENKKGKKDGIMSKMV